MLTGPVELTISHVVSALIRRFHDYEAAETQAKAKAKAAKP